MPIDRSKWTIPILKAECRQRGIRLEGRKADLIERLESYDRNENSPILHGQGEGHAGPW